ncbi:MAG: sodium/proline symporter [Oscillospiraceae bacterium]|nr:sodium/proline symporter [Oscillospiraceae bacterium]
MICVGAFFSKRSAGSSNDFYLGGRKLGPFVTAMSAEASDMSSWLLMGLPGVAYFFGIADAAWTAIGLGIGTYINWLVVAKRIRRYSVVAGDSYTIPSFFSRRYHDDKNILSCIAAVIIIVFFIPYTASGFAAVGKLFNSLFGWDYMTSAVVGAIVVVLYTVLGGFLAVSTTDLIQSIFMTIALAIVLFFGINTAGGWAAVCDNANSLTGYLSLTSMTNIMTKEVSSYGFLSIVSTMAWGLGYFGMPHLLLRFMAIEDENKIALSRRVASIWVVIAMAVAIVIGVVGYGMSANNSIDLLETSSAAESVIVKIAGLLSTHGAAAAICAGVILAGILASTMSTADSQLLAAASSVSENLVKEFFGVKLTQKQTLIVSRATVLAISLIALFLARDPNSSVFTIVSFAWAGFGAAFGPVVLFALFWKRSNKYGALAGMIAGGAMVFIWKFLVRPLGGAWNIYELLPAFLIACAVNVVVSLMTEAPDQSILDEFEAAREK